MSERQTRERAGLAHAGNRKAVAARNRHQEQNLCKKELEEDYVSPIRCGSSSRSHRLCSTEKQRWEGHTFKARLDYTARTRLNRIHIKLRVLAIREKVDCKVVWSELCRRKFQILVPYANWWHKPGCVLPYFDLSHSGMAP